MAPINCTKVIADGLGLFKCKGGFILIALNGNSFQSYGASLAIWDNSVTCHPTQVNAPRPNSSKIGQYLIYLPQRDRRLS